MNKKIFYFSLLGLVLVGIAIVFFISRPLSRSLEQVFPSKALFFARLSHVASDLDNLSQNEFWKSVSTIDLPKVLEHNNASMQDVQQFRKMQKELGEFLKNPVTKKFLGQEMAIGVYEKPNSLAVQDPVDSYDVLFSTRLAFTFQMAEFFVSMAQQLSDDVTTTTESYRGFKIAHLHFKKHQLDIQYIKLHNVLFASLSQSNLLHQVIDVYRKTSPSLAMDADFSKAIERSYKEGHGIFYINFERLYGFFRNRIPVAQKENFDQFLKDVSGFKSSTISVWPGQVLKMKMIMRFDSKRLSPYWQGLLSCAATDNMSLKFVPHNVMAYHWGDCYNFNNIFHQIKDSKQLFFENSNSLGIFKKIEKRFNINLQDDVLAVLDSQVGGYLNDIDTQGLFPYPRLVLFVKLKDRLLAENLMKKVFNKSTLRLQTEEYLQTPIHYLTLQLGENMDLGYAFLGDFLLIGTSRQLIKTSIDAFNNPDQSIQSTELLKQFDMDSSHVNQAITFLKTDDLAQRLQQLLDWYNKVISSQITMALTYQQEGALHQKELEEDIVSKKQELVLAKKKFKELQIKALPQEASAEEKEDYIDRVNHISSDISAIEGDISSNQEEQKKIKEAFVNYAMQSENAKLWLFNSDEVFVPFLKGLEGIHAMGVQLQMNDQMTETEISIK